MGVPFASTICGTLRYLITGDAQSTIALFSYCKSKTSVSRIIKETETLWIVLSERGFIKAPSSEEEWKEIADQFGRKWNFGNCIGAIDGKHELNQFTVVDMQVVMQDAKVMMEYSQQVILGEHWTRGCLTYIH